LLAVERDHLVDRLAGLLELPGLLHLPARALVRDRERLPIPRAGDVQCARGARHRVRGRGHGGDLLEHGAGGILEAHERGRLRDVDERGQARAAAAAATATATRFGARALRARSAAVMAAPPAAATAVAAAVASATAVMSAVAATTAPAAVLATLTAAAARGRHVAVRGVELPVAGEVRCRRGRGARLRRRRAR